MDIADRHLASGGQDVGTTLILGELHSHLLYLRGPNEARTIMLHLLDDPVHEWVEVSTRLVGGPPDKTMSGSERPIPEYARRAR